MEEFLSYCLADSQISKSINTSSSRLTSSPYLPGSNRPTAEHASERFDQKNSPGTEPWDFKLCMGILDHRIPGGSDTLNDVQDPRK